MRCGTEGFHSFETRLQMLLRLGGLSAGVRASPAAKLRHLATPLEKNRLDFEAHQFCFLSPVLEDHQKFSSFFCPCLPPPTSPVGLYPGKT